MNGEPFLELNNIQSRKMIAPKTCADNYATNANYSILKGVTTLLEEMVLFRTRNGSIPHFIYGTSKEPFFW